MYEFKTRVNFDFGLHRYFSRCFFFFFFISYRGLWEQVLQTFLPNNGYTLSLIFLLLSRFVRGSPQHQSHIANSQDWMVRYEFPLGRYFRRLINPPRSGYCRNTIVKSVSHVREASPLQHFLGIRRTPRYIRTTRVHVSTTLGYSLGYTICVYRNLSPYTLIVNPTLRCIQFSVKDGWNVSQKRIAEEREIRNWEDI